MKEILLTKIANTDLDVECSLSFCQKKELNSLIEISQDNIEKYDNAIKSKTFNGDNLDLIVAASSGFLCGVVDAIFLSKIDLAKCHNLGQSAIEPILKRMGGSNDLTKAVLHLEERTKRSFASDPNLAEFGGGLQHHLRDYAHHFSPLGLFFSLLTQFTGKCYGADTTGEFIITNVIDKTRIGSSLGQKLSYGFVDWFFHIASDMAGTSRNGGRGTGIPGPILSTAKELSTVLPKGKNGQDELSKLISKMFNGTFFADHDVSGKIIKGTEKPLDFRTELGLAIFENIPVLLNMICVRGFYFVRRFIEESRKKKNDPSYHVNWRNTLPFANPTIIRMTTVANCTFSAIDLAGAAIVSAAKSGGNIYAFLGNMLININYVGIGRTCISLGEEAFIGIKKHSLKKKKYVEIVKLANLYQAKLFVLENQTWIEIKETDLVMKQLEKVSEDASRDLIAYSINMEKNFETIENELKDNDKLREYILKKLEP